MFICTWDWQLCMEMSQKIFLVEKCRCKGKLADMGNRKKRKKILLPPQDPAQKKEKKKSTRTNKKGEGGK